MALFAPRISAHCSCYSSAVRFLAAFPRRPPLRLPQWGRQQRCATPRARCVTRPAPGRPDELLLLRPICSRPKRLNSSGAGRPPAARVGAAALQWSPSTRAAALLTPRARCTGVFFSFIPCDKSLSPSLSHSHRQTHTHPLLPHWPNLHVFRDPNPAPLPEQGSLSIPLTVTNNTDSCHTHSTHAELYQSSVSGGQWGGGGGAGEEV